MIIRGCVTVIVILSIFILALAYFINEAAKQHGGTAPHHIERREK